MNEGTGLFSKLFGNLAGDALGFVDPFTGSGMLAALLTGRLAGQAAARGRSVEEHLAACRRVLGRQYSVASLLRQLLGAGLAEKLAAFVPGRMLYRMTRPVTRIRPVAVA